MLFVRAGGHVAQHTLQPQRDISLVDPITMPEVPEPLLGMTNLAWNALGATLVDADSGEPVDDLPQRRNGYAHFLLDGMAAAGSSLYMERGLLGEALPPIQLAGEGGRLHGLAFNQRSAHGQRDRWREAEIALVTSPYELEVVMTVELASTDGEQFF